MVDKPAKFTCARHPEKKALMCSIDKNTKDKLLCESCVLLHNFKAKNDESLYSIKVLMNKDLINEMSDLVPSEVKEYIQQLNEVHQNFMSHIGELVEKLNKELLTLTENAINLKSVEEQEKLVNVLYDEVAYNRSEETLTQYAEQFDKFTKIIKNIDGNTHKMKFTKLNNLYKGLTNDCNNFINSKLHDINNHGYNKSQNPVSDTNRNQPVERPMNSNFIPGPGSTSASLNQNRMSLPISSPMQTNDSFLSKRLFNQNYTLERIFKASDHGKSPKDFHNRCDGISQTLVLVTAEQQQFGGFTDVPWSADRTGVQKESFNTFLFSVNQEKKYRVKPEQAKNAIYCRYNCGPTFGRGGIDLFVCNGNFGNNGSTPSTFETDGNDFGFTGMKFEQEFRIDELEVYRVIFN